MLALPRCAAEGRVFDSGPLAILYYIWHLIILQRCGYITCCDYITALWLYYGAVIVLRCCDYIMAVVAVVISTICPPRVCGYIHKI